MTDFCVLMSLLFLITCLFSNFEFILSVLFDRYVSASLDFSIVKSMMDVFITNVFKSVLFLFYVKVFVLLVSYFLLLFLGIGSYLVD